MTFALYPQSTISSPVDASTADTFLVNRSSSGTDATPAAPVCAAERRALNLARDPVVHEDLWYALCLMRPCNPLGDYGMGLAILSGYGISEDAARAALEVC